MQINKFLITVKTMKELIVQVNDAEYDFLVELLKKLDFVTIRENKKMKKEKELNAFKEKIISSLKQVKQIEEGSLVGRSAREFLIELETEH